MKKRIYILFLITLGLQFPKIMYADHIIGAEMRWRDLGNDTMEISLDVYRKCTDGAASISNPGVQISADSCANIINIYTGSPKSYSYSDITPLCASQQKLCQSSGGSGLSNGQIPIGIERHTWIYKAYFGAGNNTNCCWYKLSFSLNSRTSLITTGNFNGSLNFQSWLNHCVVSNSPIFKSAPLLLKGAAQTINYNIGAFDSDGDSLSYKLVTPSDGYYISPWSTNYPLTCAGGNNPNLDSFPPNGFNFNPRTGEIIFHPTQVQITIIKFEVTEWRKVGGTMKPIGKSYRDCMLTLFSPNGNILPTLTTQKTFEACAGQQICFNLNSSDPNPADQTTLTSDNLTAIPGSTFTITNASTQRLATATFCWTPDSSKIRNHPYCFNVALRDNRCPIYGENIYTYSIKVIEPPSIETKIKRVSCFSYDAIGKTNKALLNSKVKWEVYYQNRLQKTYLDMDSIRYHFDSSGSYIIKFILSNAGCLITKYDTINFTSPPAFQISSSKDTTACKNSTFLLSTAPLGGEAPFKYEWRLDSALIDTTQNISISVKDSAQYIVKVISGDSCHLFAYDTILIKVDTSYLAINKLNDTIICKGNSFQLSPTITYGKSPFSYFWYKNNSLISTNPVFTDNPITTSTYILKIVSSDNCYNTVYDTVIINVDTSHIDVTRLNDIVLCKGEALHLTPIIIKGKSPFTYSWYINNILISNKDTLKEIPSSATTYTLKIVSSDQCYNTFLDTVNVSFFPNTLQLKLPNDTTICANTPFTLKAQVSGASSYNYSWCPQGKTCSALPNPVYSFDATTQIILDVSSNDNCFETKRDTMMVHVFPLKQLIISATSTTINKGQTTVIKASNGNTLSWTGNDIITNWGDSILVKPILNSTYRAIGINATGCADTSEITILVTNVGINKSSNYKNNLLIYPNPAKDELIVSGKFSSQNEMQFSITNTLSQILIEGNFNAEKMTIDIHSLAPGIYFIHAGNQSYKFVKQ